MERSEVYKLLDGERAYQDSLGSDRTDGAKHTVGDYIVMLQHYQQKLVEAWTLNAGTEQALDVIRKIGGIAVHCLEDHGGPSRIIRTTWDYEGLNKQHTDYRGTQLDWNQTLVTKFNQMNVTLSKVYREDGTEIMRRAFNVPEKFRPLLETLLFYNPVTQKIGDRYSFNFLREDNTDLITLENVQMQILNYNNPENGHERVLENNLVW